MQVWILGIIGGHFIIEKDFNAYDQLGLSSGMGYLVGQHFEVSII